MKVLNETCNELAFSLERLLHSALKAGGFYIFSVSQLAGDGLQGFVHVLNVQSSYV